MDSKALCMALLRADTEGEVVSLLEQAGYWDAPACWRPYGDLENNWGVGGNQQSLAEGALAEKLINSVDACLINECLTRRIDPSSAEAPQSVREAVALFFADSSHSPGVDMARLENWGSVKARKVAANITFCATGVRPEQLNITIADAGEGQTPDRLPDTILSLAKGNKLYIPFVQGQFNQGGAGALRFCGNESLQLIISRRNPALVEASAGARELDWGFTVTRRERPDDDGRRNSMYTYLAPHGADGLPRKGKILSFSAPTFPIFPGNDQPFSRSAAYGTAVKMYEYQYTVDKSNILRGRSLLPRLDLLLPEIALPVRFYEYRQNKVGEFLAPGSRQTTLAGLRRRLRDSDNVEPDFPVAIPFSCEGESLMARVYAFRRTAAGDQTNGKRPGKSGSSGRPRGGARSYRRQEGIVFTRNGQTQASMSKAFFRRDAVKMKPLEDELLVFVECDQLSDGVREDLFMPDRERLTKNGFQRQLEDMLERIVRDCAELRELRNRRQEQRMRERVHEEKPLKHILQSLIRTSPNLVTLLELGQRIKAPFYTKHTKSDPKKPFKGESFPTYFKLKGIEYGEVLRRTCAINQRMRLSFETDAADDYFTRPEESGVMNVRWKTVGEPFGATITGPNLRNGIATVTLDLPGEVVVGDRLSLVVTVRDSFRTFRNRATVMVGTAAKPPKSGGRRRRHPPNDDDGDARERAVALAPPQIRRIYESEWKDVGFNEFTAMEVESLGYTTDERAEIYEFKVNMDNTPLKSESKAKGLDEHQHQLLSEQFLYANVLIGLSLLLEDRRASKMESDDDVSKQRIEDRVSDVCRAIAPFVPAVVSLGSGELELDVFGNFGVEDAA